MRSEGKPRLVVSDVDGTLFDRKDTVTEGLERLKSLIGSCEIPFTLASGRCYAGLSWLVEYLDIKLPVIVNNGTGIMEQGSLLWSARIRPENLREAVRFADSCGMFVSLCDAVEEKVYRHNAYVQSYIDRFGKSYSYLLPPDGELSCEAWNRMDIQKLLVIDPQSPGRIDQVIGRLGGGSEALSIVRYDSRSMDVMPGGCSKMAGVKRLAALLGIDPADIMAVGDNENDIGMLDLVGTAVAVQNATDGLKPHADLVCKGECAAGVAEAVETYFVKRAKV